MLKHGCSVAVLDLGSQTFRMVGAEVQGSTVHVIFSVRRNVRLGEGLGDSGRISEKAFERGIEALSHFDKLLKRHAIVNKMTVGTAALRSARNAGVFLQEAVSIGFPVEIITWQQEASYATRGAFLTLPDIATRWIMLDVGGGSTEIVLAERDRVISNSSIGIGAVSLAEQMDMDSIDMDDVRKTIREALDGVLMKGSPGLNLTGQIIGTGGTATTVAAVKMGLEVYDPQKVRGCLVSLTELEGLLALLLDIPLEDRKRIRGLEPERADIFPAGIAILSETIRYLGADSVTITDGGILLGLLAASIEKECNLYVEPSCAGSIYV